MIKDLALSEKFGKTKCMYTLLWMSFLEYLNYRRTVDYIAFIKDDGL